MDRPLISEQEMIKETELFYKMFAVLVHEMNQIERTRGKLNDFQLVQAVYRAKDTMGILSWDRRQTISAIFEKYMHFFREYGRAKADEWVSLTFGYELETNIDLEPEDKEMVMSQINAAARLEELSRIIAEKEAELLQFYREFYFLQ